MRSMTPRSLTPRSMTLSAKLLGASLAVMATASLSIGTADAVTPGPDGGKATPAAKSDAGSTDSVSPLTPKAKAAGQAKFGSDATYQESIQAYWTPARMAAATPVEKDAQLQEAATRYIAKQEKLHQEGKKPVRNDGPVQSAPGAESKVFGGAAEAAYNPNAPYYTPRAYTQGKVFFTKGGLNYVCSGTIINSEGKDSVWSAGHCVHGGSGGTWHGNWSFVPAYDDDLANPRPYGTWSAAYLSSRTAWTNSSDFSQDIGVATMNTNFGGWHIVDYFGGQGLTVNRGKNVWVNAFGYPGESPFDGGNLFQCWGSTSPEWDYWFSWSQTVKIPCDMTRGSSGGGWFYGWDGNWGQLNGVNSRIDRIVNPTIMLSPYFDNDAWDLFNFTRWN
jgi:hypothetical protein